MGGQVVVVALAWEPVDCLPVEWVGREVELKSCYAHLNSEWRSPWGSSRAERFRPNRSSSKVIGLEQLDETFQELLNPENQLVQVVVKCN